MRIATRGSKIDISSEKTTKYIAEKIMSKYPNHLEVSLAEIERGLISNKITSTNQ